MILTRLIFATLIILTTILFSVVKAEPKTTYTSSSIIVNKARDIASRYHEMGWFSGNILIAKNGEIILTESYGFANIDTKTQNSSKTKFNLGSIMKNFTKVLVLQQLESGKLKLDDTLDTFDLGFPSTVSSKITIDNLLNHSSGFTDIFTAKYREDQLSFDTLNKKLQLLKNEPLLFEPGTEHRYSNYGYIVLGSILEKNTNVSFEKLLRKNIFEKIGLENTSFKTNVSDKQQSTRYTYLYNGAIKEVGVTEHPSPDGGIESTVQDVQRFYRELFYGNLLLDKSNLAVIEAFAMSGENWAAFGGGLGVSAAVELNLSDGIEIVVLANTDKLVAEFISGRIQSFITTGTYEEIKPIEVNYAYNLYKEKGKDNFYKNFQKNYTENGYTQFIGKTINELGMQLLKSKSWNAAFDIFNYLVSIFPDAPQAYDSLAFAYLSKGDTKNAQVTFQKAMDIQADFNSDYISNNYLNTAR